MEDGRWRSEVGEKEGGVLGDGFAPLGKTERTDEGSRAEVRIYQRNNIYL